MKKNTNVNYQLNDLLAGLPAMPVAGAIASGLAVREDSLPEIAGGMRPICSTCEGCCQSGSDKTQVED